MGKVDGCGYDGQQKFCDAYRLCHSILGILRPVFFPNSTDLLHLLIAQVPSLRSPDLVIFCAHDNNDGTDCFTACAYAQDNSCYSTSVMLTIIVIFVLST